MDTKYSNLNFDEEPDFPIDNVYPPRWNFDNEKAWQLYRRAKREQWDEENIDWKEVKDFASGLDRKQRLAIAYWWSLLSNFDNATPVFAYGVIKGSGQELISAYFSLLLNTR